MIRMPWITPFYKNVYADIHLIGQNIVAEIMFTLTRINFSQKQELQADMKVLKNLLMYI